MCELILFMNGSAHTICVTYTVRVTRQEISHAEAMRECEHWPIVDSKLMC